MYPVSEDKRMLNPFKALLRQGFSVSFFFIRLQVCVIISIENLTGGYLLKHIEDEELGPCILLKLKEY